MIVHMASTLEAHVVPGDSATADTRRADLALPRANAHPLTTAAPLTIAPASLDERLQPGDALRTRTGEES